MLDILSLSFDLYVSANRVLVRFGIVFRHFDKRAKTRTTELDKTLSSYNTLRLYITSELRNKCHIWKLWKQTEQYENIMTSTYSFLYGGLGQRDFEFSLTIFTRGSTNKLAC